VGLYVLFVVVCAIFIPKMVPALPPEARIYKEASGASGHRSLLVLLTVCGAAGFAWSRVHDSIINPMVGRTKAAPGDEVFIMSLTVAALLALTLAVINHITRARLLSRLTEQVTFVLIPPLILIFLVLGTIFLGVATPTEGGAMGAVGALIMATVRRKLNFALLKQAMDSTARLACFVLFILIGSTFFSFTFNAADGHIWVEHLFASMPGGAMGFLIVVNILVFILGCFIDFFEIAFIVIPMLAPVAEKVLPDLVPGLTPDQVMIWFGVIIAMNLQTSFLTPPFGFALFYLRSVAPRSDYTDRVTNQRIAAVKTSEIYKGSIAFILLQIIMVTVVILNPNLVVGGLGKVERVDESKVLEQLQQMQPPEQEPAATDAPLKPGSAPTDGASAPTEDLKADDSTKEKDDVDDPLKALQDAVNKGDKK
jgi:TRAP-type mannitol/chloroaromatic compound transport system permease large subunit